MSRYIGKDPSPILDAAAQWRDRCLAGEKSVFADHELWTMEHIVEVEKNFVDKPDGNWDGPKLIAE